jgi:hypothetical protein
MCNRFRSLPQIARRPHGGHGEAHGHQVAGEKAIEVQSEYIKMAYEGFVAGATKLGQLYADIAKASYKPFEGLIGKKTSAT